MTDLRSRGLVREVIVGQNSVAQAAGLVREVVRTPGAGANNLQVVGFVREVVRTASYYWSVSLSEAASATDAISASFAGGAALSEAATAADSVSATFDSGAGSWSVSLSEDATAGDTVSATFVPSPTSLSEAADATDSVSAGFSLTGVVKLSGALVTDLTANDTAAFKQAGAIIVDFDPDQTTTFKIAGSVVVDNFPTSVFKIAGAVVLEYDYVPLPRPPHTGPIPQRCPVGMAEYTETTGLFDGYLVKGAIPGWATLRSQLRDHEYVRYRVSNSQKEEVGEGWFDWPGNTLVRTRFLVPSTGINWGPGRKILTIIEDYTNDVCEGAVIANSPLSIGIAEYTTTTGVGPYKLRGAIREFYTLLGRIPDGAKVRYRATNIAKEEVSEGIFDAVNNQLIRNQAAIPPVPVNWGPGRKLIYIIEK